MRKALKIKTSLMLLSWMVIFLHGVIPHNHNSSHKPGCHHIVHASASGHDHHSECNHTDDKIAYLSNSHADESETICHFSAKLFQNLQIDGFFVVESGWKATYKALPAAGLRSFSPAFKKPPAFRSCMLLRAPPYQA